MDIKKCELFILTAETENISKTAELSGYTQSGVSHTLKAFEKEVGVPLFKRDRYGVHLTPVANELLPYIRRLVKENEKVTQFLNEIHGFETGNISIGIPFDYPNDRVLSLLKEFHSLHPGIGIQFKEGHSGDITEWVLSCQVDLGIHHVFVEASTEGLVFNNIPLVVSIKNRRDISPMVNQLLLFLENYEV